MHSMSSIAHAEQANLGARMTIGTAGAG